MFVVLVTQFEFQVLLALLLFLSLDRQVNRLIAITPLLIVLFTVGIVMFKLYDYLPIIFRFRALVATYFINYFNPVLLYILSYTAKGKLVYKR